MSYEVPSPLSWGGSLSNVDSQVLKQQPIISIPVHFYRLPIPIIILHAGPFNCDLFSQDGRFGRARRVFGVQGAEFLIPACHRPLVPSMRRMRGQW
jgi:hypothetical protein